ncbi:MAG: T9SS type A sorting domain-containing protein [Dysgonamonadaceae bacterium]|jgi:hypothetical protein|nr:T9SS type A sorting domain-containing protein [Dysgonamonadaceae bacterium]
MKKITFLLASCFLLAQNAQSAVPVNICGDMYIQENTRVNLDGRVLVDTVADGNARLVNCGAMNFTDTLLLASRRQKFGLVRNSGTLSFSSSKPGTVGVLLYFLTGDSRKYHSLSFPFDVAINSIRGLNAPQTFDTDYYLMTYDGAQRAAIGKNDINWRWISDADGIRLDDYPDLKAGEGYFIFPEQDMSLIFPANTPAANPTFFDKEEKTRDVLIHTGPTRPTQFGWNFVGNLQTDSFKLKPSTSGYSGFVYYHAGDGTFSYKDFSEDADELLQIPFSGNAFVMQAYSFPEHQSGIFTVTYTEEGSFRSSASGVSAANVLELTLTAAQNPYTDLLRIQRDDRYSDGFVQGEDAPKMFSFRSSGKPEFYTVLGEQKLVFDKRRQTGGDIPLGIDLKGDDTYTISINKQTGYEQETALLVAQVSGVETVHNLSASPYVFQSGELQTESRYALRMAARLSTGIEQAQEAKTEIVAYSRNHQLHVKNLRQADAVQVYDASGQLLSDGDSNAGEFSCTLPQAGVYILKVSGARAYTTKIVVK